MYFGIIEVIRGISCLIIVLYHFNSKFIPNGYLGVDQFYIISGYLITFSVHHNHNKSFNVLDFLNKRVKRILPLKCVILFYVLIVNKYYLKETITNLELNSITAFLFYFNFKLINDDSNYFSSSGINLILNYWSLSVEEQYYLYVSILSFFTVVVSNCFSIVFHISAGVLSFMVFMIYFNNYYVFSFYSIYSRIWEFSCGSLIYFFDFRLTNAIIINVLFFLQILLAFSNLKGYICFIIVNLITYLQINYSKHNEDCILSNSVIKFVGRISYSIYLFHYSNILLFNTKNAIALIAVGSLLLYFIVEKPMRNYVPGLVVVLLYIVSFMIYYIIYCKDYKISIQKHVYNLFIKDMCSYDIIDKIYQSKYKMLLLGDSHVLQYIRAFYDKKHEVVIYHSYFINSNMYKGDFTDINYLLKYKFDIIILGFWQQLNRDSTYDEKIYHLINKLKNITNKVLVVTDIPYLKVEPNNCLYATKYCYGIVNVNCSIVKPYNLASYNYSRNLKVYDYSVNKYTVKGNICPFEMNGLAIYSDHYHLSSFFVENILMNEIHTLLNRIMNKKVWIDKSISNVKFHCLESDHNIYRRDCINNKYTIPTFHN